MLSINWAAVVAKPVSSLTLILVASLRAIKVLVESVVVPSAIQPLGLRNAIARAWLGTVFVHHPDLYYSEPPNHDIQTIQTPDLKAYIIPRTESADWSRADAVVIYAHGGGMIFGHPLQYLKAFKRWAKHAESMQKRIVFVAVRYPLSVTERWPAQRNAMIAAYRLVLQNGVPASRVTFAGDSAGGNLAMLTMLHIRDRGDSLGLPAPASGVIISPFFDMTGAQTRQSVNQRNDFLFSYDSDIGYPIMNSQLRPEGTPPDTPEISSLLHENVGNLPPHLLIYSRTEVLGSDSERWCARAKAANVDITEVGIAGELHTFAIGWPVSSMKMQRKCDELICRYILDHAKPR